MFETYKINFADIGHNDSVKRSDRLFHIQTELHEGDTIRIKTTIFQGGGVIGAIFSNVTHSERKSTATLSELAKSQHDKAVMDVREGKYD